MVRPRIGLALGSGASRGLAHIGVISTLLENNIPIDCIAGCSSGALVGALFCCGADLRIISRIAKRITKDFWMDIVFNKKGVIAGKRVEEFIRLLTKDKSFEELDIPLCIVSTDILSSKRYIFDSGKVWKAVRASISIPGVFCPVEEDGMILVDGGVLDRVPVTVVRQMGADIVIAVDVGASMAEGKFDNFLSIIVHCIETMENEILKYRMEYADVCIRPLVKEIDPLDFSKVDLCISEGQKAAFDVICDIKRKIKEKSTNSA